MNIEYKFFGNNIKNINNKNMYLNYKILKIIFFIRLSILKRF